MRPNTNATPRTKPGSRSVAGCISAIASGSRTRQAARVLTLALSINSFPSEVPTVNTSTIVNPKTGRENKVQVWNLTYEQIRDLMRAGKVKTAKDLSWILLSDKQAEEKIESELSGDCADNNFGLRVFETGLDWGLGLKVLNFVRMCVNLRKKPKPFKVAANRKGDCFIITASGRIL